MKPLTHLRIHVQRLRTLEWLNFKAPQHPRNYNVQACLSYKDPLTQSPPEAIMEVVPLLEVRIQRRRRGVEVVAEEALRREQVRVGVALGAAAKGGEIWEDDGAFWY